jgi:hypothetical protein
MTNLNLANNSLGMPNGWSGPNNDDEYRDPNGEYHKALPAGSSVLGVIAIANAIPDMGAISTFTFSGDEEESEPVTMETTMTEADFSGKLLGVSGGMMAAALLPKCQ